VAASAQDIQIRHAKGMPAAPVTWLARDKGRPPQAGIGLSLSGGGTRAVMFHAGALLRLFEMGVLSQLKRISGVSGGSITAGVLALKWPSLAQPAADPAAVFKESVIEPLRSFVRLRIDIFAWLRGTLTPWSSPVRQLADELNRHLYDGVTLRDLPDEAPRFVFNATNISTGVLWRFSKPYMADYRLGRVMNPDVRLAIAVAASSAFPPFFSPLKLAVDPDSYVADAEGAGEEEATTMGDVELRPFRAQPHLADGGVYDNLGLETVWKRYRDVLVSDGGGGFAESARPRTDLILQSVRVMKTIDRQVRSLRRNVLIRSYQEPDGPGLGWRRGAYWGIRTKISDYDVPDPLPCPSDQTAVLASEPTRLWRMREITQERLINWGYAAADAAVRAYYRPGLAAPHAFPYPNAAVG
jgi:NTE family protein